ncbi:hypothetical protein [Gardnerella swidsinskii]|uniref:hypothetical protein n=1 Tax=Gardnerella swidsinskii TaxID=2792979 RepID=UPI0026B8880B
MLCFPVDIWKESARVYAFGAMPKSSISTVPVTSVTGFVCSNSIFIALVAELMLLNITSDPEDGIFIVFPTI